MPVIYDDSQAGAGAGHINPDDPGRADTNTRIKRTWDASVGVLPTRMVLHLAQSPLADHELDRASHMLARQFDLDPSWMLAQTGVGHADNTLNQFLDPVTGDTMSFATAQRFIRPFEAKTIRRILGQEYRGTPETGGGYVAAIRGHERSGIVAAIPGVDAARVAKVVTALAPIDGTRIPFAQVLAAAVDIARDPGINIGLFARNLQVAASASALDPLLQVAAAHRSAANGKAIHSFADIASAVLPSFEGAFRAGETLTSLLAGSGQVSKEQGKAAANVRGEHQYAEELARSQQLNAAGTLLNEADPMSVLAAKEGQVSVAGLGGTQDWFKFLTDTHDDYVAAAKEIAGGVHIPFSDSIVGHFIGKTLNLTFRPLDAIYRVVMDSTVWFDPLGQQNASSSRTGDLQGGTNLSDAFLDARDILLGKTTVGPDGPVQITAASAFQDLGYPPWVTTLGELFTASTLDPFQISLDRYAHFKAAHLLSGLAEDGKAADWQARAWAWVNAPVRRIGDLRNVSTAQYLVREASRSKDAERFFGRAVGNFRTYFGTDGLNPILKQSIFDWVKSSRKLGMDEEQTLEGVKGLLMAGFGSRTDTLGELAAQVEATARVRMGEATQRIIGANSERANTAAAFNAARKGESIAVEAPLPREAQMALSVLSDSSLELLSHNYRMLEIPHTSGPIGRLGTAIRTSDAGESFGNDLQRTLRSVMQTNPEEQSGRLNIHIEDPVMAETDFGRGLIRSQMFTNQEVEKAKLGFNRAMRLDNPTREIDTARVIGTYDRLIMRREMIRWDIPEDMAKTILKGIDDRTSHFAPRMSYGAFLSDTAERAAVGEAQSRMAQIDTELGLLESRAQRAVLHAERDQLEAEVEVVAQKSNRTEIRNPFMPSQFRNEFTMHDPVLFRQGISEMVGTLKKWAHGLGLNWSEFADPVHALHTRKWMDGLADTLITGLFMAIWKPLAVLRPAYILRVVGLEEQSRFFATVGLSRRLEAGKRSGAMLERLGMASDRYFDTGISKVTSEVAGQRNMNVEDAVLALSERHVPGMLDERGWSQGDQAVGEALAQVIRDGGTLNAVERQEALRLVRGYKSQLSTLGLDVDRLHLRGNAAKAAEAARVVQDDIEAGRLRLRLPGLLADEPLANNNVSRIMLATQNAQSRELAALNPNKIGVIARDDKHFVDFWYNTLANQFGHDVGVGRRYLLGVARGDSEDKIVADTLSWLRKKNDDGPMHATRLMGTTEYNPEDLEQQVRTGAHYIVDIAGQHPQIAQAAYDGTLTVEALKSVPPELRPLFVHGPLMDELMLAREGPIKRGRDALGRMILQTPTNTLSRQPYFKSWYDRMYGALVEEANARGVEITAEELKSYRETARQFAIGRVNRIMFDFSRSGRLEELTRYFTVFLQPFLEFPTVWSRIIRENPSFIGHALRLGRAGVQSGFVRRDPQTGELVVPLSFWAGAAPLLNAVFGTVGGTGFSLSAPLSAFNLFANSSFPVPTPMGDVPVPTPSLTPPFQWAMQQFFERTPLSAGIKARMSSWLFQYGELGPNNPSSLLPGYMRHLIEAVFPDQVRNESYFQQDHFLQLQQAQGHTPDASKARWQAREFAFFRTFFGLVFPAAPKIEFPTQQLEDELKQLQDTTLGLGYQAGTDEFLKRHPDLRLLTIARTMWDTNNPDNPSPTSLPANALVNRLLETKGAKDFAKNHPQWVWAIIPKELQDGTFDPGTFFAQIAKGQRIVRSPGQFLAAADVQAGWDGYFAARESYTAAQERLAAQGIKESDTPWIAAKDEFDAAISDNAQLHKDWFTAYNQGGQENMDPNVMREARILAADKLFTKTEVGQGLVEYLKLRDSIAQDLGDQYLHSISSVTAGRLGITQRYTDGVAAIEKQFPQFATAYRLFFTNDLAAGVKGTGDQVIDNLDPTFRDDVLTPWVADFNSLKLGPSMAIDEAGRNAAYDAIRSYVNEAYNRFPAEDQNPMLLHWATMNPTDRSAYLVGLAGRSYVFANRFDKQTILGQQDDNATEQLWTTYGQLRTAIAAAEAANPQAVDSTAAYAKLDGWVLAEASANPNFAAQVQASNTWGYAFSKVRTQIFPVGPGQTDQAAPEWASFLESVHQMQTISNAAGLTGINSYDPRKRAAYIALRSSLQSYADTLAAQNPAFKAQWDYLEQQDTDPAVSSFMPDASYPLGGTAYALSGVVP